MSTSRHTFWFIIFVLANCCLPLFILRHKNLYQPIELTRLADAVFASDVILEGVLPAVHVATESAAELDLEVDGVLAVSGPRAPAPGAALHESLESKDANTFHCLNSEDPTN